MKPGKMIAAAALVAGIIAPALAQPPVVVRHVVVTKTVTTHTSGPAMRHKHCRTVWYRHARVRRCTY